MPKRHSPSKPVKPTDPVKLEDPSQPNRPPLPNTSRTYGKVTGGKVGQPLPPKAFSHRKRG